MMNTSLVKWLPWHDPTGGGLIIMIIIFVPAFLLIGSKLFILSRFFLVSKINKSLPVFGLLTNTVPILIKGYFSNIILLIVTLINLMLCLFVTIETIRTSILYKTDG